MAGAATAATASGDDPSCALALGAVLLPHCPNCPIASMPHCPNCPNCSIAPHAVDARALSRAEQSAAAAAEARALSRAERSAPAAWKAETAPTATLPRRSLWREPPWRLSRPPLTRTWLG